MAIKQEELAEVLSDLAIAEGQLQMYEQLVEDGHVGYQTDVESYQARVEDLGEEYAWLCAEAEGRA